MVYDLDRLFVQLESALSQTPNRRLADFSQSLHVNQHTIQKAVRENTGASFREYQKERIVVEALRLLAEEDKLSIEDIAANLGYTSAEAFSRFIKVKTGRRPSDFRGLRIAAAQGSDEVQDRVPRPDFLSIEPDKGDS